MNKRISFLGIEVGVLTKKEIVGLLLGFLKGDYPRTVFYLNAHCVNIAHSDPDYRSVLNKADLVYAGGQGVVWAAKILGSPLPERVNILDFFDLLAKELRKTKLTIYLLGGRPRIVKKTEEVLKEKGLEIIGSRDGFFDKTEEPQIIREINNLKPHILMVGMGVPKQEKWIYSHLNELDVHLCWAVGGVFDLFAGRLKRAPRWVSNCGLEWLYLGLQNPKRLLRRYLLGNFLFVYRVLKYKFNKI